MKKMLQVIICVLLMAATVLTVSATASAEMTVSAAKTTVYRGDVVDFTVNLSQVEDCRSAAFMLVYDSSVFEFVSGSCSLTGTALANFSAGTGTFAYGSGTTVSGEIFTFQLKVKEDAAFGDYTISANVNTRDSSGAIPTTVNTLSMTVACSHSFGDWSQVDDADHKRICTICQKEETEKHTWDGGTVLKEADCKEGGQVRYACTACGATTTEDTPQSQEHKYGSWEKVDDAAHKHACTVCEKEETADHTWDNGTTIQQATCLQGGQIKYTCTGCGATTTEDVAQLTTHAYTNDCDTDCNVCGAQRSITHSYKTAWIKDETRHWHACSVCGDKKDSAKHTPGPEPTESRAQTCTVCNYIIKPALGHEHSYAQSWSMNDNGHWYACSGCEDKGSYADHDFENACDADCSVCGFTRMTAHNYTQAWEKDETNHWHACTNCGEKADTAAHIPGPEATATAAQTCTVCSHEIAPALQETTPDVPDTTEPVDQDEQQPLSKWAFLAVILIICGAVIIVVARKRK